MKEKAGCWLFGLAVAAEIFFAFSAIEPPRPKRAPVLEKRRGIKYESKKITHAIIDFKKEFVNRFAYLERKTRPPALGR